MAPSALYFHLVRGILRNRAPYNHSIAPFFRHCHPFVIKWVLSEQPQLQRLMTLARSKLEERTQCVALVESDIFSSNNSNNNKTVRNNKKTKKGKSSQKEKKTTDSRSLKDSFVVLNDPLELGEMIRLVSRTMPNEATTIGLEASRWLEMMRERIDAVPSSPNKNTELAEVGDLVVRNDIPSQRGVVGAILPFCFQSNEWVKQYLGSLRDKRISAPWYLVLVEQSENVPLDFTRYGSTLTHTKETVFAKAWRSTHHERRTGSSPSTEAGSEVDVETNSSSLPPQFTPKSIGLHRYLPLFFRGFDPEKGVYLPHYDKEVARVALKWNLKYAPGSRGEIPLPAMLHPRHHELVADQE